MFLVKSRKKEKKMMRNSDFYLKKLIKKYRIKKKGSEFLTTLYVFLYAPDLFL